MWALASKYTAPDGAAVRSVLLLRADFKRNAEPVDRHGGPELHSYVIAVDNLADAVRVILRQYPGLPSVQTAVTQSLQRFSAATPDVHGLRNLIEHFDECDHMD